MFDSFFIHGALPANVETGVYQAPLVMLSYVVASFASYTALSLAQQLVGAKTATERRLLHWGGAFAMGAGIWSMHFIGMLSYKMQMAVDYDPRMTLLSMVIATAVAYIALGIVAQQKLRKINLIGGGILMGIGICSMHYTGMAAMEMGAQLLYIPPRFMLSVAIAVGASVAAIWMAFTLARHSGQFRYIYAIAAALVMGAAICGMHYTGMWAAVFIPYADCRYDPNQNFDMLALSIAGITTIILTLALIAGFYKKQRTEMMLQASEAKLRAVIDHALDGLITVSERNIIESFNSACERIFGYRAEEVIGSDVTILMPKLKNGECYARRKDGNVVPVDLSISTFELEDGKHYLGIIRDITARKESDAKIETYMRALERSNQELDDFAYIASHDLKEPLRGLHNQASFLMEDYADKLDDEGVKRLKRLGELSQRMERLINDLLYFSRLGRSELAIKECDPNKMIEEIEEMMEVTLKERNARIVIKEPLPKVICDKPRITEVFRNLITNAVKYSDKKERLVEVGFLKKMETKQGIQRDVFYVKDNGIGIAPEFHEDIFRLFKRLQKDDKESGTGVGLTFVKKILQRHKGHIWLESEVGKGTTFYFTLGSNKQG